MSVYDPNVSRTKTMDISSKSLQSTPISANVVVPTMMPPKSLSKQSEQKKINPALEVARLKAFADKVDREARLKAVEDEIVSKKFGVNASSEPICANKQENINEEKNNTADEKANEESKKNTARRSSFTALKQRALQEAAKQKNAKVLLSIDESNASEVEEPENKCEDYVTNNKYDNEKSKEFIYNNENNNITAPAIDNKNYDNDDYNNSSQVGDFPSRRGSNSDESKSTRRRSSFARNKALQIEMEKIRLQAEAEEKEAARLKQLAEEEEERNRKLAEEQKKAPVRRSSFSALKQRALEEAAKQKSMKQLVVIDETNTGEEDDETLPIVYNALKQDSNTFMDNSVDIIPGQSEVINYVLNDDDNNTSQVGDFPSRRGSNSDESKSTRRRSSFARNKALQIEMEKIRLQAEAEEKEAARLKQLAEEEEERNRKLAEEQKKAPVRRSSFSALKQRALEEAAKQKSMKQLVVIDETNTGEEDDEEISLNETFQKEKELIAMNKSEHLIEDAKKNPVRRISFSALKQRAIEEAARQKNAKQLESIKETTSQDEPELEAESSKLNMPDVNNKNAFPTRKKSIFSIFKSSSWEANEDITEEDNSLNEEEGDNDRVSPTRQLLERLAKETLLDPPPVMNTVETTEVITHNKVEVKGPSLLTSAEEALIQAKVEARLKQIEAEREKQRLFELEEKQRLFELEEKQRLFELEEKQRVEINVVLIKESSVADPIGYNNNKNSSSDEKDNDDEEDLDEEEVAALNDYIAEKNNKNNKRNSKNIARGQEEDRLTLISKEKKESYLKAIQNEKQRTMKRILEKREQAKRLLEIEIEKEKIKAAEYEKEQIRLSKLSDKERAKEIEKNRLKMIAEKEKLEKLAAIKERARLKSYEDAISNNGSLEDTNSDEYDYLLKLIIIGDIGVGKSSTLLRFSEEIFPTSTVATAGMDFKYKIIDIDEKRVKIQVWDTGGQERFRCVQSSYYRGAHGIILMYDVTDEVTFKNVRNWMDAIEEHAPSDTSVILVANKADVSADIRQVSYEQGRELAREYRISFFEVSALLNNNILNAVECVAEAAVIKLAMKSSRNIPVTSSTSTIVKLSIQENKSLNSSCC